MKPQIEIAYLIIGIIIIAIMIIMCFTLNDILSELESANKLSKSYKEKTISEKLQIKEPEYIHKNNCNHSYDRIKELNIQGFYDVYKVCYKCNDKFRVW